MARAMKPSGIEWLGDIPADWEIQRIKTIFRLRDERNYSPLEEVNLISLYTDIGVVQHNDLEKTTGNKATTADGYKMVYENDIIVNIILCWMGAIGRSAYTGVTSPAYDIYVPSDDIESRFYHYYFRTNGFSGDCYKRGKGIMAMRWRTYSDKFRDIKVAVPPLDEQQRIAAFLDGECARIDSVVEKTRASIEEYRKLKQAIITRAVTKGIRPNRPTKDSGVEWLGQIPESYDVRRIKYLGSYRNGLTYTPNELVDETEGTLVLRSSNIQQGQLCFTDNVYVKTDIPDRLLVQKGDIIICSRNGSRDLIGKCAIVENDMVASFGAFMMIFRCVAPKYMYYILNSDVFKYYLSTFRTSTINQLTSENFGNMEIVWCADKTEQKEIAAYLDEKTAAIDSLVAKKNRLVSELESLKKSLIFEYVTGKKEVPK